MSKSQLIYISSGMEHNVLHLSSRYMQSNREDQLSSVLLPFAEEDL